MRTTARALCPRAFAVTTLLALAGVACSNSASVDPFTALNFDTHAVKFPLNASAHAGIDCNVCHGAFASFAQFDCLNGCHAQPDTDPGHGGVPGYMWSSDQCYSCHPTGKGIDHEKYFPIASGRHSGIACATCHVDTTNRKNFSCLESPCHRQSQTDGHHREVGGYQYLSSKCYDCHPNGRGG